MTKSDHVVDRLREGEILLQQKSCGRLIHISDFVNEVTGWLVIRDENGEIKDDAREIIYPGSNGDAWWDHTQLLAQVERAIKIFETAHPNCVALFIFDQSSAHCYDPASSLRKRNDVQGKGWLNFSSLNLTNRLAQADTEDDISWTRACGSKG